MKNAKKGFTIIEIAIVVAVIVIMASIAIPALLESAKVKEIQSNEKSALMVLGQLPDPNSLKFSNEKESDVFVSEWRMDSCKLQTSHGYFFRANMECPASTNYFAEEEVPVRIMIVVYAWPVSAGNTGNRSFARLADGSIYQSLNSCYSGGYGPNFEFSEGKPVFGQGTWEKMLPIE